MVVKKICKNCGREYEIPRCREGKSKFCCKKCANESKKANPNVICAICGKPFHLKPYHIKRCKGDLGFCCSKECMSKLMKIRMTGEGNHQYGLKGSLNASFKGFEIEKKNNKLLETMAYYPQHPKANSSGRVTKHRLIVELNHELFDESFFTEKKGFHLLKDEYEVHHIDGNHSNNDITNLQILTKGEHVSIHNKNRNQKRDAQTGRFIK